ncbi:hypothetical protein Tco_1503013 [Tanacetum coccineum]
MNLSRCALKVSITGCFGFFKIFFFRNLRSTVTAPGIVVVDVPSSFVSGLRYWLEELPSSNDLQSKDYLEYGLPIPETILTEAIKQSESYQMFIKYSTEESEPEPELTRKKTTSKRRVKNKVTLSADDNIISDDPNAALELAKSISQTEAE